MISITPSGESCGAVASGVDLTRPLDDPTVKSIRSAWLEHHVLVFPDQALGDEDFERFVGYIGPIGDDPFFEVVPGKKHIAAVQRDADETGRLFADIWHSDWSFMPTPPAATCLFGITIPPVGGDTIFVNEHKALDEMPANLRDRLNGKIGKHSARQAYSNDGQYAAGNFDGAMTIKTSDEAKAIHGHPLIRNHPETGRPGVFGGSYVFGLQSTPDDEANALLADLNAWLDRPEFQYRHVWQANMLIMWDNRSVLHKATGGYEGHARLLHRLTVADNADYYLPA